MSDYLLHHAQLGKVTEEHVGALVRILTQHRINEFITAALKVWRTISAYRHDYHDDTALIYYLECEQIKVLTVCPSDCVV